MKSRLFFLALFLSLCTTAFAQNVGEVGAKVPEFQLGATDGRPYGVSHSSNTISVLFFVGWN